MILVSLHQSISELKAPNRIPGKAIKINQIDHVLLDTSHSGSI